MHAPMYPLLHGWRGRHDSERALRKGSLSYAGRASGVKNKMTRSAWKSRIYNGPNAVCAASTSATCAVPCPPPALPQAPHIPGEPIHHAQTRTTPRHPAERRVRAGLPPCFRQSRRQRRHKPKSFCTWLFAWSLPKQPALWRLWRATRFWQSPYSLEHVSWLLLSLA
jgi:hypothetical protein